MLVGFMVGVVIFGLAALYVANREHSLLPAVTVVFVVALVGTFVESLPRSESASGSGDQTAVSTPASLPQVLALVRKSNKIERVPSGLVPSPVQAVAENTGVAPYVNIGYPPSQCVQTTTASSVPSCVFGDVRGAKTMVLYGDSHAGMWFRAINEIAKRDGWKLVVLFKGGCPASLIPTELYLGAPPFPACDEWHRDITKRIDALDPDLLVVSQQVVRHPDGPWYTTAQWQTALEKTLRTLHAKRKVVLGDIPYNEGPQCLLKLDNVHACSAGPDFVINTGTRPVPYEVAENKAARASGASYVSPTKWLCRKLCSPVIGSFNVYYNVSHVAVGYSMFLEGVLAQALAI